MNKAKFYIVCSALIMLIIGALILLLAPQKEDMYQQQKSVERKIQIKPNNCADVSEPVNIALITDSRYIPPTATSISSALKNKCPESIYNFYIITEDITLQDETMLMRLKTLAPNSVNIKIIPQKEPDLPYENMQRFLQYKVGMHKIYLPEILSELDKVIYMDGDTIVLKDLHELFDIDVADVYVAVAKDGIFYRFPKEMQEMGLDKRGYYFNSGVMLYNLALQRQDNITEKLVEYIKTHEDFFGDQDVLNMVFGDKLKLMSYRYNCISTFFEADDLHFLSTYFGEPLPSDTFDIYENATIIHYAGDKPWQQDYKPLYLKELWFRYYNEIKDY